MRRRDRHFSKQGTNARPGLTSEAPQKSQRAAIVLPRPRTESVTQTDHREKTNDDRISKRGPSRPNIDIGDKHANTTRTTGEKTKKKREEIHGSINLRASGGEVEAKKPGPKRSFFPAKYTTRRRETKMEKTTELARSKKTPFTPTSLVGLVLRCITSHDIAYLMASPLVRPCLVSSPCSIRRCARAGRR